jgi:hypothetical protein
MIDPISLAVFAYIGVAAVVFVAVTLNELYSWFRNRGAIKAKNQEVVAFTLAQRINSKNYATVPGVFSGSHRTQVVQGFYNPMTNKVIEGRVLKSNKATAPEVARMHEGGAGLVVYS